MEAGKACCSRHTGHHLSQPWRHREKIPLRAEVRSQPGWWPYVDAETLPPQHRSGLEVEAVRQAINVNARILSCGQQQVMFQKFDWNCRVTRGRVRFRDSPSRWQQGEAREKQGCVRGAIDNGKPLVETVSRSFDWFRTCGNTAANDEEKSWSIRT